MDKVDIALCSLNKIFGFHPVAGRRLLKAVGNPYDLFDMDRGSLKAVSGGILGKEELDRVFDETAEELEMLSRQGSRFVGMDRLPELLLDCTDPPLGLYVKSSSPVEEIFGNRHFVAVVGTRDMSHYGQQWCRRLTRAAAQARERPTIVSGLALGVDITAHRTALECGAPTIAVLPTGLDRVYPWRHEAYADEICAAPGSALVSDYPPGTVPLKTNFLRRNRIIAGLSQAVLLVESKIHGGGMMTARLAHSYGRTVLALPGRADDLRSEGCLRLISDQVAELVYSEKDLLHKLGFETPVQGPVSPRRSPEEIFAGRLPPEDLGAISAIYGMVATGEGIGRDELSSLSGLPASRVQAMITLLETEGLVQSDILGRCSLVF